MKRQLAFVLALASVLAAVFGTGAEAFRSPGDGDGWADVDLAADGGSVLLRLDVDAITDELVGAPVERARCVC